jgi:hypothetical protein
MSADVILNCYSDFVALDESQVTDGGRMAFQER